MPYIGTDFASNLQYLQNPPAEENIKELTPTGASTETEGSASPAKASAAPTSSSYESPSSSVATSFSVKPQTTGSMQERLFQPAKEGLASSSSKLQDLTSQFYAKAGPSRTYDTAGIEEALRTAIQPGSTPEQRSSAKGYLSTSYGGPSGISAEDEGALAQAIASLQEYMGGTRQGAQLKGIVSQAMPGSQSGEQLAETKALLTDPSFIQQQNELEAAINEAFGKAKTEPQKTREYAAQRTKEEADIANLSKSYLAKQKEGVTSDIQAAVDAAQKQQDEVAKAWKDYQEKGVLPKEAAGLESDTDKKIAEANAKWSEIIGKYPDIQNVPILQLYANDNARKRVTLPEEFKKSDAYNQLRSQDNWEDIWGQLLRRQTDLERYFSPYDVWSGSPINQSDQYNLEAPLARGAEGEYSKYKPLYFGLDDVNKLDTEIPALESPSRSLYMKMQSGMSPSRGNVSTEEQRDIYNNIMDVLGEADRIQAEDPVQAAIILTDVTKYLDDEKAVLDQWDTLPTQAAAEWDAAIRKARDDADGIMNKLTKAVAGVGGALLAGPLAPLGAAGGVALANRMLKKDRSVPVNPTELKKPPTEMK